MNLTELDSDTDALMIIVSSRHSKKINNTCYCEYTQNILVSLLIS